MKFAIIENEFGEVGVDDALVLESKEEIVEMNNGCICCTGVTVAPLLIVVGWHFAATPSKPALLCPSDTSAANTSC